MTAEEKQIHRDLSQYVYLKRKMNSLEGNLVEKKKRLALISKKTAEIDKSEKRFIKELVKTENKCLEIQKAIDKAGGALEKAILVMYYCDEMKIERIAVRLNLSYSQTCRLRNKGLNTIAKKMRVNASKYVL